VSDGVVRKAGRASALLDPAKFEKSPRQPIAFVRTQETRMLMEALSRRLGAIPEVAVLPLITVSTACQLHGGCARLCPTGALRMVDRGAVRELRFDAAQCIDCGACAKSCPESALRFDAPAWRVFSTGEVVLSQRGVSECPRCGDRTLNSSEDGLCANCSKAGGLARAGFALFGRGASSHPAETGPP
jgi:Fe-S-cluster-containing dehydrogenase component